MARSIPGAEPTEGPPVGGALLECLFSFQDGLGLQDVASYSKAILWHSFAVANERPFYADDGTPFSFEIPLFKGIEQFLAWLKDKASAKVIINFTGALSDVEVKLGLLADFTNGVVSVSVREDMLWAFSDDLQQARKDRLEAFFKLCRELSAERRPAFAHIGTESVRPEEINASAARASGFAAFDPQEFFSAEHLDELFDWYVNIYARRWENSISLKR